ncbi:hypothetical protein LOC68_09900 [Blastopirellula sp. JC732]|uniref:Uncharacterized protein n=1 Tax=Blastopirellula sediminis TaxID=2894196 RepID=A0A9X1MLC6_9BACT|nr:hypothetical protein [Blastopirellula sediminis]MCC9608512.1 hypothetical protein [Blastopirellula sediminis]MCC9628711.1 hypothetical protein [Blastopirellula sediminis]
MMTAPEATFSYPGVGDFVEVRYTLAHGVSPGRITLRTLPGAADPAAIGAASFRYAGTQIAMPNCRVDSVTAETDYAGRSILRFEILDQRWAWKFGAISGEYNIRTHDGKSIQPGTEQTPRQLAQLCLDAMGEQGDVAKMPDRLRPYVNWDYKVPALALADLADACGCRVVLKIGGKVAIEPAGQGAALSITPAAIAGEAVYDPPETPTSLKFVAAPSLYQVDFDLAPVAVEPSGEIVPLDDVSYAPPRGWKSEPLIDLGNVETSFRELAQSCVWKYYQIQPKFTLPGDPKTKENVIERIEEVLPLLSHQVEADPLPDKTLRRRPPWVYGLFEKGASTYPQVRESQHPDPNLNDVPEGIYTRSFRVDHERGLVIFTEPVFLYRKVDADYEAHPARLKLRIACQRRDKKTRGVVRYEFSPQKRARQIAAQTIVRDDIAREVYVNHKTRKVVANEAEVKRQAEYYLAAAAKELQAAQPGTLTYDGFWPINPDGAIRQVSWSIGSGGRGVTIVSRNWEDELVEMSYRERRLLERMVEMSRTERRREQRGEGR